MIYRVNAMHITPYIDDVGALNQMDASTSDTRFANHQSFPLNRVMGMHIQNHLSHRSSMKWPDLGLETIRDVRQREDIK